MRVAAIVSAAAFVAVSAAVRLGGFMTIDQWAIDHVMPWVSPIRSSSAWSSFLPFTAHTPAAEIPAELWLYPASPLIAGLITAGCCAYLWRRGERLPSLAWASAWVVVNAIEVVGKHAISRQAPHMLWRGYVIPLPSFADSFPSGHAARALLLAALVAAVRPRLRMAVAAWLAVMLPLLVVTNAHAPSDVVGGLFLSGAFAFVCLRLSGGTERPRAHSVEWS